MPTDYPTDDELLARLAVELAGDDPVPPLVLAGARDSFAWRTVDAELARLVADSLLATVDVRGDEPRLLTYQAGDVVVELEVTEVDGRVSVAGQLVPPTPARVRVEQPGGVVEVDADRFGRFTVGGLNRGPTRFVCTGDEPLALTEWTLL
jgi:hypothetical protein